MKLAGVVILYHPDESSVVANIASYLQCLTHLYVFINSPISEQLESRIKALGNQVEIIKNPTNEGIAKPLNKAIKMSSGLYPWIITMDQDSSFEKEELESYLYYFSKYFYQAKDIAIVSPQHTYSSNSGAKSEFKEVMATITSGSWVNVSVCQELSGFNEKLFIDDVDIEYCYRCITHQFKVIEFSNIYLRHQLGTHKEVGYFGNIKKSKRILHSPFRVYFMVRNHLYVEKQYAHLLPDEIKQKRKSLFTSLKNNLLFSGQFIKVMKAIIKGYRDFKQQKFST